MVQFPRVFLYRIKIINHKFGYNIRFLTTGNYDKQKSLIFHRGPFVKHPNDPKTKCKGTYKNHKLY